MEKKLTDSSIQETIEKTKLKIIESKSKLNKFEPITNMNLDLFGKRYNLHVCNTEELEFLHHFLKNFPDEIVVGNYTVRSWTKDIRNKADQWIVQKELIKLESILKKLQEMYTPEMKNQIEFDNILKSLGE